MLPSAIATDAGTDAAGLLLESCMVVAVGLPIVIVPSTVCPPKTALGSMLTPVTTLGG